MYPEWDYDWLDYMDSEYPIYWDDDDWGPEPLEWYDV